MLGCTLSASGLHSNVSKEALHLPVHVAWADGRRGEERVVLVYIGLEGAFGGPARNGDCSVLAVWRHRVENRSSCL